jgi:hypothetical protein
MRPAYVRLDRDTAQYEAHYADGTVVRSPSLTVLQGFLDAVEARNRCRQAKQINQEETTKERMPTQKQADAAGIVAGCLAALFIIAITAAAVALW